MMSKSNLTQETVPFAVASALKRLGSNIALARKRRGMQQEELAAKAGTTHVTLRRVERGNPTTSIAAYFVVLWAMGLDAELADLASPDRDEVGKQFERNHAAHRVRRSPSAGLSDEF